MLKIFVFPLALVLIASSQERVGTSRADLPSSRGAFSIENATGVTIPYQVKWGEDGQWKSISLGSGHTETHSYPLAKGSNATAPPPFVRFDRTGGDGRFTPKEYHMRFHRIGYAGVAMPGLVCRVWSEHQ